MYLAHHGGPEGIIDKTGWKLPACLFVVYPYKVGEAPGDAMVPWFGNRFGLYRPLYFWGYLYQVWWPSSSAVAFVAGFSVYFAILTQAITVAAQNFFTMNNMKFCGTSSNPV